MTIGALLLVIAGVLSRYAISGWRKGQIRVNGLLTSKAKSPYRFWIGQAFILLMAALSLAGGIQAIG